MTRFSAAVLCAAAATSTLAAQGRPAPRQLGAPTATSTTTLGSVNHVRALPGGMLLVNDALRRQVLLFDESLGNPTVVADTSAATANAYSGQFAGLIPYRGDSTLFVDPQSLSMMVIDPKGQMGRVLSIPVAQEAIFLAGAQGQPGFDAKGRLLYRGNNFTFGGRGGFRPPTPGQPFQMPAIPDTAPIKRVDLSTRTVDTAGWFKTYSPRPNVVVGENGSVTVTTEINPFPTVDTWAVMPNGDVALVRGRDYHIDWLRADGTTESSAKIPFNWRRLNDEEKVALIDSVKAARARMPGAGTPAAAGQQMAQAFGFGGGGGGGAAPAPTPAAGGGAQTFVIMGGPGMERAGGGGDRGGDRGPQQRGGGGGGPGAFNPTVNFVEPSALPDYLPAFAQNAARADADGTLWIQLSLPTPVGTGALYDVINGKGELVDHVQLPGGRTLVGFAAGGVAILSHRDEAGGFKLERVKVK
ncbi:MAG: hypothetical protein K2X99_05985 [Gemmatimonadaceae bacterium]|nr:hypothetical protein [Gemmatimonadaceae bacterium]